MQDPPEPVPAESLHALNYEIPPPTMLRIPPWVGVTGGFFISFGIGWIFFGVLMAVGMSDGHAGPISLGTGAISFGALLFYLFILRK